MSKKITPKLSITKSSRSTSVDDEKELVLKNKTNCDRLMLSVTGKSNSLSVKSMSEYPTIIGLNTKSDKTNNFIASILVVISWSLIILFFPVSLLFTFKIIKEYERAVIYRLGRIKDASLGPGIVFHLPCIDTSVEVDMRTISFDVEPQEVLTRDSVTISVDAVVYCRVFNPAVSISNVENADGSTKLLAQTTLRNVLGEKSLSEILSDRETLSESMKDFLDEATDAWVFKIKLFL